MIAEKLAMATPGWAKKLVPQAVKDKVMGGTRIDVGRLQSFVPLQKLMLCYQTKDLVNVDSKSFHARLEAFMQMEDAEMEGFLDPTKQRDLSIKFHWGHDHDFGDFSIKGKLGFRHIALISALVDWFPVLPQSLEGARVLDIGCWSGGTSLLMCAMGAHVVAVEEVKKYIDCLNYLKFAFDLKRLEPRNLSLYECASEDLQDSFDYVLFAGVLYHVTDPILALRITYNCLKDGGKCLIETAVTNSPDPILAYEGPAVTFDGSAGNRSRSGWNWFSPSPVTLLKMMGDVGFVNNSTSPVIESGAGKRIMAVGQRRGHADIMRGGLSVRNIR